VSFSFGDINTLLGTTFARFRLSATGQLPGGGAMTADGFGGQGEVEDYQVVVTGPLYQNPNNRFDVNADGAVTVRDALAILSLLQRARPATSVDLLNPPANLNVPATPPPFYDVEIGKVLPGQTPPPGGPHRNVVNVQDALAVIRELRRLAAVKAAAGSEGEGASSGASFATASPASSAAASSVQTTSTVAAASPASLASGAAFATTYASSSVVFEVVERQNPANAHDDAVVALALSADDRPTAVNSSHDDSADGEDYFTALGEESLYASSSHQADDDLASMLAEDVVSEGIWS
jgi:hypothetical protein